MDDSHLNAALPLRKLSADDYGRAAQSEDGRVVQAGGVWWREIRPMFFRPALPFEAVTGRAPVLPSQARWGGAQYLVPEGEAANSTLSFLMFPQAESYTLERLKPRRRLEVKAAAKEFSVRLVTDLAEFKRQAHPVYVEFHRRTRYGYLAERIAQPEFERWAAKIYATPGTMVFGAYRGERLEAVNISRVVNDTLLYATFFASDAALQQHAPSLVLHAVREVAAQSGCVKRIYAGMPKEGAAQSIDTFYLLRGCTVDVRPARLQLNRLARLALKLTAPAALRRMQGVPMPPT